LVAVGADYNLLLISRIRDEARNGVRTAVIRTISATGGVITSAGLIFAASMFGMVFSSISAAVQIGFIIGVGLLLDTFLVRTVTVPAIAALLGSANWWPSKLNFAKKAAAQQRPEVADEDPRRRGASTAPTGCSLPGQESADGPTADEACADDATEEEIADLVASAPRAGR
jgi:RND superfamily putative drug exporter